MALTRGTFYRKNLQSKLKLFASNPKYVFFYLNLMKEMTWGSFDVTMVSYPKSGRTWLQMLLLEAIRFENGLDKSYTSFEELAKDVENLPSFHMSHAQSSWQEVVKDEEQIKEDDFASYRCEKIIYLYRDPRDVLVSQYHHIRNRTGVMEVEKDDLIFSPLIGLTKITNFMNKWWDYSEKHSDKILKLNYESLKADTSFYLQQIFKHIGYTVSNKSIEQAVDFCEFKKMQKREAKGDIKTPWFSPKGGKNNNALKARSGKVGEFKTFFTEEQIADIDRIIDTNLNKAFNY